MKRIAAAWILVAALPCLEFAQEKPIRIALTAATTIPTADISKDIAKKCPKVILTQDAAKADYTLEAVGGDRTNPHGQRLYKFTLFNHEGDVVFATETRQMGNALKDVCAFIQK